MPTSKPDAHILLEAATAYLEQELLPTLTGYHRFRTRITINVLAMVRRELTLADEQAAAERARLAAIIGRDGTLDALNDELVEKIRAGAVATDDERLRDHVRRSLAEALAINNPKWVAGSS
jgi:hypothetical protein